MTPEPTVHPCKECPLTAVTGVAEHSGVKTCGIKAYSLLHGMHATKQFVCLQQKATLASDKRSH